MGGKSPNPIKEIQNVGKTIYTEATNTVNKIDREIDRSTKDIHSEYKRVEKMIVNLFSGGGGSSQSSAPPEEEKIKPIVEDAVATPLVEEEDSTLSAVGTKATGGFFEEAGRVRISQKSSGIGSGATSGLGY